MTNEMMLIKKLKAHPDITKRMLALIEITEAESGSFDRADEAEDAVVTHVRLGNELMSDWGASSKDACQLGLSFEKKHLFSDNQAIQGAFIRNFQRRVVDFASDASAKVCVAPHPTLQQFIGIIHYLYAKDDPMIGL